MYDNQHITQLTIVANVFMKSRTYKLMFIGRVYNCEGNVPGHSKAHERVWLVEWKPIWLPRAYLTRGDLEPARGNLHVCKFLRDLKIIQIRTVTAEWAILFWVHLPDERVTSQGRKEGEGRKEGRKEGENLKERERERRKEGRRTREKAREKEQLLREREKALDSIRPETNTRVLSWINTRISFLLPFTPALDNNNNLKLFNCEQTND